MPMSLVNRGRRVTVLGHSHRQFCREPGQTSQIVGQGQASKGDFQSKDWAKLRNLGQPRQNHLVATQSPSCGPAQRSGPPDADSLLVGTTA